MNKLKTISLIVVTLFASFWNLNASAKDHAKILIIASNMINMGDPEKHDARNNLREFARLFMSLKAMVLRSTLYHQTVAKFIS